MRRLFWTTAITVAVATVAVLGLWWRLSNGPIELDIATPWLKAAIEENFGGKHTVVVGGTQIERDEKGRTSLRLRDIIVRDADGTVVASTPKAEVGLSGMGLLTGHVRAHSLNLVGAEMAVRIETDGRVTVFAGADKRPIATAAPAPPASRPIRPRRRDRCARISRTSPASWPGSTASARPASTVTICANSVSRTATSSSTTGATASVGPSTGSMRA